MSSKEQSSGEANIQTFLRIRPSKKPSGYFAIDDLDTTRISFTKPENLKSEYINNSKLRYDFQFNGILPMETTQEDVFKKVGTAAVQNALEG
jgi:kinesin family protein 6/9